MVRRYLLFAGKYDPPAGGMYDIVGMFDMNTGQFADIDERHWVHQSGAHAGLVWGEPG